MCLPAPDQSRCDAVGACDDDGDDRTGTGRA